MGNNMSDELTQIQIEIEKVKLEREKLALERELKQHYRAESVVQASANTVYMAGNAVKKTGSYFMYVLIFFGVLILVFLVMCLFSAVKDSANVGGDFGYRMGWYLTQDFWLRLIVGLVGGFNSVSEYRDKKNGVVKPQSTAPMLGRGSRILISSLLWIMGIVLGFLGFSAISPNYMGMFVMLAVIFFLAWLTWPKRH
jgi:hypothetical protein